MNRKLKILFTVMLAASLLLSGCLEEFGVSIEGQVDTTQDSGTINLEIDPDGDEANQPSNDPEANPQQNQPAAPTSQGMLIIIGLGLLILAGLTVGLMSRRRIDHDHDHYE